jgi:DNA polymerase-3 subunit beta
MRIICTQENFNKGLGVVSHIANKNSNLPILNNVLLKAEKEGLTLITTDLEIGIKVFVRSKIETPGEFTVDAKLLNSFVSLLPRENREVNLEEGNLEVKTKNQETTINGMEAEDFPLIPDIDKENEVNISGTALRKSLSQAIFAASLDTSRVEINAVNFVFKKDELVLAATDSYRLAEKKLKIENDKEANLIVPLKTLQELLRILGEYENQQVKIYFNENQIMFAFDGVELVSRVIDGKYPDYKQIIPDDFSTISKIKVSEFVPAIKSVALFCKQGINDIRFSLDSTKNELVIATASSSMGTSTAKVPIEIKGEDNDIVFNYRYLLDGLSNMSSDEVELKINNNASPGLIQPTNDKNYKYLVMPIRQ